MVVNLAARGYEQVGHHQPLAYCSHREDTQCRGIGAVNVVTGQVTYRQASKISPKVLADFYAALRADYPDAEVIYVAQDNSVRYAKSILQDERGINRFANCIATAQPLPWKPWLAL